MPLKRLTDSRLPVPISVGRAQSVRDGRQKSGRDPRPKQQMFDVILTVHRR